MNFPQLKLSRPRCSQLAFLFICWGVETMTTMSLLYFLYIYRAPEIFWNRLAMKLAVQITSLKARELCRVTPGAFILMICYRVIFWIFFAKTLPKQKIQGHCMQVGLSTCNAAIQAAARAGDTGLAHEMLQEMRALDVRPVPRLTARGQSLQGHFDSFCWGNGWKWYVVSSVPLVHVFASAGETVPVVVHIFENTHFWKGWLGGC